MTPEEKREIVREVVLELARQFRKDYFWVPMAEQLESSAGPEKPTTPISETT